MVVDADSHLDGWLDKVAVAESLIPVIGKLYREQGVITSIHGRSLINQSPIGILKLHRFARQIDNIELSIDETAPLLLALQELELNDVSLDLAQLAAAHKTSASSSALDFLSQELADTLEASSAAQALPETSDVVLYGFGRIGRLLARIIIGRSGARRGLRLRAIVVRRGSENDLAKRASLLRRDSVHGPFDGTILVDEQQNTITANGTVIKVIYSNDPATVDYESHGIRNALVIDNTGRWRDREGLSQHLNAKGVSKVLLTAPGKGDIKNIVQGINHDHVAEDDTILSAASCTTNAIVPVLKVINDEYGIEFGHVETVHSYTNDQNLIDNFHKGDRRGRAAALNLVITETGAASAVAKALPELAGKLTGNAIRVPTPNVSLAILNLTLTQDAQKDSVNAFLRNISLATPLRQQIDYVDSAEVVSSDFVGSKAAGVVDGLATISTGKQLVLYVWYDNEYGYSNQVVRLAELLQTSH